MFSTCYALLEEYMLIMTGGIVKEKIYVCCQQNEMSTVRAIQGNRMKITFCRNNACKDSGQKGAGFPPAREQRSEYSIAGQQNIHSIALPLCRFVLDFFSRLDYLLHVRFVIRSQVLEVRPQGRRESEITILRGV
jgi:hypothetical protein